MECVKQTTDEIENILFGSDEALYRTLHVKMNVYMEDVDTFDSQILRRMSAALVDVKDPERNRLCSTCADGRNDIQLKHHTHQVTYHSNNFK